MLLLQGCPLFGGPLIFGGAEDGGPVVDGGRGGDLPVDDAGVGPDSGQPDNTDGGPIGDGDGDADAGPDGPSFIGGPCDTADDCLNEDAFCATDVPGGMCTAACNQFCPDLDGYPTTFCVDEAALEGELASLTDGACHQRCDFLAFPGAGCRDGYGCTLAPRANENQTEKYTCIAGAEPAEVSDCQLELAALNVAFSPTTIADTSPETHPNLTCHVEDPVIVHPPIAGVDFIYFDGTPTPNITMSCEGATALARTAFDAADHGVSAVRHIGTYNCRAIAGTDSLSQHSFGDAIDIYGYDLAAGPSYILEDEWEHDTSNPVGAGAQFLYDTSWRYFDDWMWNIVLTPNYNAAHDNHFHVDMTPASHFRGVVEGRYRGTNPHPGE